MKISVIIPVYNCVQYVRRCVQSIIIQTYTNLEIICIDDGSTDGSGSVLDELAKLDSRIYVIHQENTGVSGARNAGIEVATGEWITFVDADDAIESDMYEILLTQASNSDIDIVHCGYKRIGLDGIIKDVNGTGKIVVQNSIEAATCLLQGTLFVGSLCNKLYRAYLFEGVRLDTTLAINEDILANAELIKKANALLFYDIGKYLMYERKGSATSGTKQKKIHIDCVSAAEKMYAIYSNTPVEECAAKRLSIMLMQLYRWYVRYELTNSYMIRKELDKRIRQVMRIRLKKSVREYINYYLLRFFPHMYKIAYGMYDRIRIPNWDVE